MPGKPRLQIVPQPPRGDVSRGDLHNRLASSAAEWDPSEQPRRLVRPRRYMPPFASYEIRR